MEKLCNKVNPVNLIFHLVNFSKLSHEGSNMSKKNPHQNPKDEFGLLIKLVFSMGMAQGLANSSLLEK